MAQTGASAYTRLQVPQDGMDQALQFWGAKQAQKNADDKLAEEREAVRKKQDLKDFDDKWDVKSGDFQNKYTGFQTFDDINTDFAMDSIKQYVELHRQARQALMDGKLEEKTRLEGEMIRLKNSFGEAAKSQEFFAEKFKDYQKAVSEGRVSGASKDFENIVQEALQNKNYALRYRDGNLVYVFPNVNGKQEIIPYQDLMDGSFGYYEKQQISGPKGIVDNILSDLGSVTNKTDKGMYKITEQLWDEGKEDGLHSKATGKAIDALLGNNEVMGDLLYQFSGQDGSDKISKMHKFSDSDYKLVKDNLKDLVRAGYDEKYSKEYNTAKANALKPRGTGKDKTTAEEAVLVKDNAGLASQQNATAGPVKEYTVRTKAGTSPKGLISDMPNAELLTVMVGDDGKIYGQIRNTTKQTDTTKEQLGIEALEGGETTSSRQDVYDTQTAVRELNDSEIARVAQFYKVGDRQGLLNYFNQIGGSVGFGNTTTDSDPLGLGI